jgi:hypothetical protein
MKKEQRAKRAMSHRPVQRETKEVLAELEEKLTGKLELKARTMSERKGGQRAELGPNLDRLTAGVDLGDQSSQYCMFGLGGRDAARGTGADRTAGCSRVFPGLNAGADGHRSGDAFRLVQEIIAAKGPAVRVANPRLMGGRNDASTKMIGAMRTSWPSWGEEIHSRCTRSSTGVGRCARIWCCCERAPRWWQRGRS